MVACKLACHFTKFVMVYFTDFIQFLFACRIVFFNALRGILLPLPFFSKKEKLD